MILRAQGDVINTHFRSFDKPMGLAIRPGRLAIGSAHCIWEFHDLPAVGAKVKQEGEASTAIHDACFLPRTTHWTGDVQVHEMAWVGADQSDLWFINTRFSCLCRRSETYSFEPVWRPWFVKQYEPTDVCHLNGLAVRDQQVRYVTALGQTNQAAGWRENKRDGGILIDVIANEIIAEGLSMPHSPRWYRDRLWLLESGTGSFGFIDSKSGKYESIVQLDGFTRGVSFAGPLAFVGLSQVRESAVFGGIPIAEKSLKERLCGVWVINIESGQTIGFVRFEDAVQEIFSVEVLHAHYPELVNEDRSLLAGSFELPDDTLQEVPEPLKQ